MMRFYQQPHRFYCGVDLHARSMYLCVLDTTGQTLLHRDYPADARAFLDAVAPYRESPGSPGSSPSGTPSALVVAVECMFAWYWLADLCAEQGIPFVLGHALYMKAIHQGKSKNDRLDAAKIAGLLRGGLLPQAYVYPKAMRATRDLLRRRSFLVRRRADLLAHLVNTNSQYNLPALNKKLLYPGNRGELNLAARFAEPSAKKLVECDLALIDALDLQIHELERHLIRTAKVDDAQAYARLQSIPGIGKILGLVLLYEIHDIGRFPEVGNFLSYARLVRPGHESAGKAAGFGNKKIGNAHLRWALGEAACLYLRASPRAKRWQARMTNQHGSGKTLGILAAKLGRTVYHLLRTKQVFDEARFFSS
jgi:transposase